MRNLLRILAALIVLAILGIWWALGAHRGWSQTSVPVKYVDPVTEIEFTEYEKRFVPGLEFLALGLAGAIGLFGITLLLPRNKTQTPPS